MGSPRPPKSALPYFFVLDAPGPRLDRLVYHQPLHCGREYSDGPYDETHAWTAISFDEMRDGFAFDGTTSRDCAGEAHWQMGKVEAHGRW